MTAKDLINVLMDISKVFTSLIQIQKIKLQASLENDIGKLQGCMKKEQAASMELKSLERHRLEVVEALGYASLNFDEMIQKTDMEYATELNTAVNILISSMRDFGNISDEVRTVIEMNLANLDMLLAMRQAQVTQTNSKRQETAMAQKKPIGSTSITDFKA